MLILEPIALAKKLVPVNCLRFSHVSLRLEDGAIRNSLLRDRPWVNQDDTNHIYENVGALRRAETNTPYLFRASALTGQASQFLGSKACTTVAPILRELREAIRRLHLLIAPL